MFFRVLFSGRFRILTFLTSTQFGKAAQSSHDTSDFGSHSPLPFPSCEAPGYCFGVHKFLKEKVMAAAQLFAIFTILLFLTIFYVFSNFCFSIGYFCYQLGQHGQNHLWADFLKTKIICIAQLVGHSSETLDGFTEMSWSVDSGSESGLLNLRAAQDFTDPCSTCFWRQTLYLE